MKLRLPESVRKSIWPLGLAALVIAGFVFRSSWWPQTQAWVHGVVTGAKPAAAAEEHDDHGHSHAAAPSLELSEQARLNLGLTPEQVTPIRLEEYSRSITVPALVTERPGRTHIEISAPLTGVVTAVHVVPGAAVEPGDLLFELRLTHEDLVQAQVDFLKSLSELDVEIQEIARLQPLVERGAVAATVSREREYSKAKLEALLSAQREALKLHGLSESQVNEIANSRRLLREVRVYVPSGDMSTSEELQLTGEDPHEVSLATEGQTPQRPPMVLQELRVHKGQALQAGATMCVLADYGELYIEGAAFEQDALALAATTSKGWKVDAVFEEPGHESWSVPGLEIAYLANEVDVESRTLHFYVRLPNELLRDAADAQEQRFVSWRYRPGQRLQLRVPVEKWDRQIVLPLDAVAREGAEYYVFVQNGKRFEQVAVHVRYKDQFSVVIDNDGALFPGDVVARRSAHQMLMAIKSKSGAAPAVHTHADGTTHAAH